MDLSRRTAVQAGGLLLVGAVAGGVLAATVGASASSSPPPSASYAAGGAPADSRHGWGGGPHRLPLTGTVTSVGSGSVTITVGGASKTYVVDGNSDIDKNGEAKLSDLAAGDAVRFALRPDGKTIAVLHAGDEAKDRPAGVAGGPPGEGFGFAGPGWPGPGGRPHRLPLTGTVTSVGSGSVTITVGGASKTYVVDGNSDIDKNGEAKLSDLAAGDAVRFALRPDGKTIAVLHAGDEAKDRPAPPAGAPPATSPPAPPAD